MREVKDANVWVMLPHRQGRDEASQLPHHLHATAPQHVNFSHATTTTTSPTDKTFKMFKKE